MTLIDYFRPPHYRPAEDMWIVSAYFNPDGYKSKRVNLEIFLRSLECSGLNYLLVECAFNEQPFFLPASRNVLRVRSGSVMWQKERLLNLAISKLPKTCSKVAWLDADILFAEPDWAVKTSHLLDKHQIVQPYHRVIRLPPRSQWYQGTGEMRKSFAYVQSRDPTKLLVRFLANHLGVHGSTGFAWAARADILRTGSLYDCAILGGGDHLMAHGFCGDCASVCVKRIVGRDNHYAESFEHWTGRIHSEVKSDIGFARGTVLHLWHGEKVRRQYSQRARELLKVGFDPNKDLRISASGAWEWVRAKSRLQASCEDYFRSREEDTSRDDTSPSVP